MVSSVRDLGVYLDADLTMTALVNATITGCFAALLQLHSVWWSLSKDTLLTLLHALVSKVDCYSTVLAGISGSLLDFSQCWMPLRGWYSRPGSQNTTSLLRDLHWLKVRERIRFRLLCSCAPFSTWHRTAVPHHDAPTSNMSTRRHLRSAAMPTLVVLSDKTRRLSCCSHLERSSSFVKDRSVTDVVQAPP